MKAILQTLPKLVLVLPTVNRVVRTLLVLPLLLLLLLWCWYHWRYRRILTAASTLPTGIPTLPVIGHLYILRHGLKSVVKTLILVGKSTIAKGVKIVVMWLGPYPVFCVQGAEEIQMVVSRSKTDKSYEYNFIKFALGNGLLTAPDDIHRVTRRYVNPLFHSRNLDQLTPVFNQSSRQLVQDLSQHVGGGHIDVSRPVAIVAFRNVSCVVFGPEVDIDTKSEEFLGLIKMAHGIAKVMLNRLFKVWLWPDALFEFLWRKEIDEIHMCWKRFADGPLKVLEYKNNSNTSETSYKIKDIPLTLPDTYKTLQHQVPYFTNQDMHSEMITLIMAGADTTKITISSCLLCLAAYPNIQEKCYQEIISVAGVEEKDVTVEDIHRLPYLDQVIKETLRKFSVLPLVFRTAKEDINLSDCMIPSGATIAISILSLHHDPSIFADPEVFNPDRFSPENISKIKKYAFLPFSGGSRSCIGVTYAAMLVKTVLIHLLRRYRLITTVDINSLKFKAGLAMISDSGYNLQLHHRD